ncbi:MAG TPA: hypothetical protein VNH83_01030, partial [Bryobacteraceae bacterium]|nr:hypothetical protein [Bryobacteraceae bacterium]
GKRGISIYTQKLTEALNTGGVVQIMVTDAYMKHQIKSTAKKLGLKLVYALADDFLYIKPIALDGEQKRLLLLLREPRTENELKAKGLELHLKDTLSQLAGSGLAHILRDKWVLTEKGMDAL